MEAPSWQLAHKANLAAVAGGEVPLRSHAGEVLSGFEEIEATRSLLRSRQYLEEIGDTNFADIASITCDSKEDLVSMTHEIIVRDTVASYEHKDAISKAALLGVGDTLAVLSMIARAQPLYFPEGFNAPAYESAVKKSQSILLHMARLSSNTDASLVVSIMNWSRTEMDELPLRALMCGLEYNESFFDFEEDGSASLKALSEIHQNIHTSRWRPHDFSEKEGTLMGCPFRSRIVRLCDALTVAMIQNGIAESIYYESQGANDESTDLSLGKQATATVVEIS